MINSLISAAKASAYTATAILLFSMPVPAHLFDTCRLTQWPL